MQVHASVQSLGAIQLNSKSRARVETGGMQGSSSAGAASGWFLTRGDEGEEKEEEEEEEDCR